MSELLTPASGSMVSSTPARSSHSSPADRIPADTAKPIAQGTLLELNVVRGLQGQTILAQIRQLGPLLTWSAPMQIELTTDMLDQKIAGRLQGSNSPALSDPRHLLAEVVATKPRLIVRLLPAEQQHPANTRAQPPWSSATRLEWHDTQLRLHLPQATPLASTIARWRQTLAAPVTMLNTGTVSATTTDPKVSGTVGMSQQIASDGKLYRLLTATANPSAPTADGMSRQTAASGIPHRTPGAAASPASPAAGDMLRQMADGGTLHRSIERLFEMLPSSQQLANAQQLQQSIEQSGLWLESSLARLDNRSPDVERITLDLKGQLYKVAHQLRLVNIARAAVHAGMHSGARGTLPDATQGKGETNARVMPTPPAGNPQQAEPPPAPVPRDSRAQALTAQTLSSLLNNLGKDADGMVKQVVVQQLQTLELSSSQPHWCVTLPFKMADQVHALEADIEQPAAGAEDDNERNWKVALRLDLPRLGNLTVRINLRGECLSTGMHAEQAESVALLREHLATLKDRLESRAIEVTQLHASQQAPEPRRLRQPKHPLLTESA